MGIKMRVQ